MSFKCLLFLYILGTIDAEFALRAPSMSGSCPYPRLDHGKVRMRQKARLVKFICYPRYEIVGNKYATCRDGQWDVPLPVCVKPGCAIPRIKNGLYMPSRNEAWVVYFCLPGHKLVGSTAIYCDGNKWNGTAPVCVDTLTNKLSCDFEDPDICGWTQDELHDFDWRRLNRKTPSSFLFTGPSFDHTLGKGAAGYYMYIESTSRLENDTARLISPIYSSSLLNNGCFSFAYHMFGKSTGGLRVYQKPDRNNLQSIMQLSEQEKKKFLLFEKWGNQGDVWYNAVAKLKTDIVDNFQIVIEGIRGSSFTSDIAIDDVAILQGDNCTAAMRSATTPAVATIDSCAGRCDVFGIPAGELGCGCTASCVADQVCCPDFFDLCVFAIETTTTSDDNPSVSNRSTELPPQTQKLVATTPEIITTAKIAVSIKPVTTTTIGSIIYNNTPTTRNISYKPINRTTKVIIPTLIFKSTTPIYNATGRIQKDKVNKTVVNSKGTTKFVTVTTKFVSTTTNLPYGISRTVDNHNVYHEMVEKAKKERLIESRIPVTDKSRKAEERKSSSSGVKTTLILVAVLSCCAGVAWAGAAARSARGRAALARLRGRVARDPEVRYLHEHEGE